jgi:hypothetical protein
MSEHEKDSPQWQVKEQPFVSNTPVIGPLIVRFREAWNGVAAKWYVRPLIAQQNEINRQLVETMRQIQYQLIEQDKTQTNTVHDTAEITAQLVQMNRLLQALEERLAQLEGAQDEA